MLLIGIIIGILIVQVVTFLLCFITDDALWLNIAIPHFIVRLVISLYKTIKYCKYYYLLRDEYTNKYYYCKPWRLSRILTVTPNLKLVSNPFNEVKDMQYFTKKTIETYNATRIK